MKRRFIRLEEIEQKTAYTKGDILELIEQRKLSLCALVVARHMSTLHRVDGGEAVSMVFSYDGMVALDNSVSRQFTRTNNEQPVRRVTVLQPENMQHWRSPQEVFGDITKSRLNVIANVSKPQNPFVALTKVEMGQSLKQVGSNFIATLLDMTGTEVPKGQFPVVEDAMYFQSSLIVIPPQDLRLDLEALNEVCGEKQKEQLVTQSNTTIQSHVVTSPLVAVVYRAICDVPNARADKLWNMIRKDVNTNDRRVYDMDDVIDDMTADSLAWFGKDVNTVNKLSYESFRKNTVYKARKLYNGEHKT